MEDNMIKYSMFLMIVIGTSVAGFNAVARDTRVVTDPANVTVAYKTEFGEMGRPIILERCRLEDCSDTPQS